MNRFLLPRMRIERRIMPSRILTLSGPILSVILGLFAASVFLLSVGANPFMAVMEMIAGSFGSHQAFFGTLVKAIPLMLCGLGLSIAFRMNLWNIGAEGQLYIGAAGATWFALSFPEAPFWLSFTSMALLAMFAGGFWCLISGILKAYLDVNEIIVTLMLNYIAILFVDFMIYGPWKDPHTFGFPLTPFFGKGAELPVIFGQRVHLGLVMALAAALFLYFFYKRTHFGFEMKVIGLNPSAACYAGMDIKKTILYVMFASGALAGLAGMSEVAGLHHRLQPDFSPGYGYTAIIVAWLANLHPLAILAVSILLGGLLTGGDMLQITMNLPLSLVNILQGLMLFFILIGEFFRIYRVNITFGGIKDA